MKPQTRRPYWSLLGLLVVAGLMVCSGGSAEAACGDWLAGHAVMPTDDAAPASGSVDSPSAADATEQQPASRQPCSGPACSRVPDLPLTPAGPPEPTTPTSRLQAVVGLTDLLFEAAASWLAFDDSLLLAEGPLSRIERPPMPGEPS